MNAQHTPGPWEWNWRSATPTGMREHISIRRRDSLTDQIAVFHDHGDSRIRTERLAMLLTAELNARAAIAKAKGR